MAEVTGIGETYNLTNQVGRLFLSGDAPRTFLNLIGTVADFDGNEALRAPRIIQSNQFNTNVDYDLDAAAQPSIAEDDATTFDAHDVSSAQNVVQIFDEGIKLSYSVQSNVQQVTELGTSGEAVIPGAGQGNSVVPGSLAWQVRVKLAQMKRDLNYTYLRGTYALGAVSTARTSRGVIPAITTNATDLSAAALSTTNFEAHLKDMIDNGAFSPGDRVACIASSTDFKKLVDLYATSAEAPRSRTEAGVMLRTIWTAWGPVDCYIDVDMPATTLLVCQPQECQAVFRSIKGGGIIVAEPLAKTGPQDAYHVYFESGLDYGAEWLHGKITNYT